MEDADDPIPADCIRLSLAFNRFFQKTTPNWRDLEYAKKFADDNIDSLEHDGEYDIIDLAHEQWDEARGEAEEHFRSRLMMGNPIAYIRDPISKECLQLREEKWALPTGYTAKGIEQDFIAPGDSACPGPKATANGRRRPVFFKSADFENLLAAVMPPAEQPKIVRAEPVLAAPAIAAHTLEADLPEDKPRDTVVVESVPFTAIVTGKPLKADLLDADTMRVKLPKCAPKGTKQSATWRAMKLIRDWGSDGIPVGLSNEDVLRLVNKKLPEYGNEPVALETVRRVRKLCS